MSCPFNARKIAPMKAVKDTNIAPMFATKF